MLVPGQLMLNWFVDAFCMCPPLWIGMLIILVVAAIQERFEEQQRKQEQLGYMLPELSYRRRCRRGRNNKKSDQVDTCPKSAA